MIRRPPRSTQSRSSAASDVYKRQVRRLFSSGHVNPTLGTLAEVAAALGMRVVLEPLDAGDREQITRPLLEGSTGDPRALAERTGELRRRPAVALAANCPLQARSG